MGRSPDKLRTIPITLARLWLPRSCLVSFILASRFGGEEGLRSRPYSCRGSSTEEVVPAWRNRQTRRPHNSLSASSSRFESGRRHPPHHSGLYSPPRIRSLHMWGLNSVSLRRTSREAAAFRLVVIAALGGYLQRPPLASVSFGSSPPRRPRFSDPPSPSAPRTSSPPGSAPAHRRPHRCPAAGP